MLVFMLCSFKTPAFKIAINVCPLDEKVFWSYKFMHMSFNMLPYIFYPRLYCITDILNVIGSQRSYGDVLANISWGFFTDESEQTIVRPRAHPCIFEKIKPEHAYILDNGEYLNILVNSEVPP